MSQRPAPPKAAPPKAGARTADPCGSHVISRFVGADAAPTVRNAIIAAVGHDRIRWITPGTAVTQDFSPDRLNVILDQNRKVLTMRCG